MLCIKRTENENATNIEKIYDKKTIEYYNKGTSELLCVRVEMASNLLNFFEYSPLISVIN